MPWSSIVIQHCHCSGLGHCCGVGSVSGLGTFICRSQSQSQKKKKKKHATCHHANSFFPFSQFVFLSVIYGSLASESESPRCMFKMHVLYHSHSFQLLNQNLLGVGLENNIFHAIALNTKYVHLCKVSTTVPVTY